VIYGILEDDQNNLWLSTSNGIFKYSYRTGKSMNYGLQDGVQSLEFSGGAYFKTSEGEMYFGGISGMNHFFPQMVKNNQFIPPVVITSIKIANNKLKGEFDSLNLSYDENFITFEFAALSYSNPEYNYYSYMLSGLDDNWKFTDAKYRVANYTNLPPGKYTFKVRGANHDRVWNPKETEVYISISPPFWRTFWFVSLAILFISSAIYYLGTIRSRNELQIERLKAKLAADLHDNIGSGLTEISILSELAQQNSYNSNLNVEGKLKSISEISRQLVDNMSDIVWVVNPNRDSLRDLLVRLKDSYSDILNSFGISFRIVNIDKLEDLSLPMEYRQNLYLMFKEGINNTIKHSKCKKITLEANVRNNVLELTLKDDGIGFSSEDSPLGNGIRNIETRSKNIGGKIKWKSSTGMGTTITFIGEIKNRSILKRFVKSS
jgi:two-component sensor histidine kinase